MKILKIQKFQNGEEKEFTYGLYDGEEEIFSCICPNDEEARKMFSQSFREKELDERYGKKNWKIDGNIQ